jgi:hypothetical protein
MEHTTIITDVLKLHFAGWHFARIKCLSSLIVALFKVKTVNLTQLASAFPGRVEVDSHYRRLQRFFQHVEIKPALIAHLVVSFLPYSTPIVGDHKKRILQQLLRHGSKRRHGTSGDAIAVLCKTLQHGGRVYNTNAHFPQEAH